MKINYKRRISSLLIALILILSTLPVFAVSVQTSDPTAPPAPATCLCGSPLIMKLDAPADGTYSSPDGYLTVTITGFNTSDKKKFSWTSSQPVCGVFLKGGNTGDARVINAPADPPYTFTATDFPGSGKKDGTLYEYNASKGGNNLTLHQPSKQISHITFYYCKGAPQPSIEVIKTANPTSVPEPGAQVTFSITVNNTGNVAVSLTDLVDDVFLDLDGQGTISLPQTLAIGGSYSGTFTAPVNGDAGYIHKNTVTATAYYNTTAVTDTDDATVTITDVPPTVNIEKTADPTTLPEPGGDVEFTFVITNTCAETITVTELVDSVFGDLLPDAEAQNGDATIVLDPTKTFSFTIVKTLSSTDLKDHVNTVTVTVEDNEGTEATDSDDATVGFTDVLPTVTIDKTANPGFVMETGGNVEFTFVITNTCAETITVTALVDSVFGDLLPDAEAQNGDATIVLDPTKTFSFKIVRALSSLDLKDHVNTVTVTVVDNEGTEAKDSDDATVEFTDVLPTVTIDKTANPGFVMETGGDVEFTFVITNTCTETITVTALTDSVFGNLLSTAEAQNGNAAIVLDPQETFSFKIVKTLSSLDLKDHVNTVTVTVVDNEQTTATDTDDATVMFSAIRLVKSGVFDAGSNGYADVGELITFTFTVTNPSKVDLNNVTVNDDMVDNIVYVSGDTNGDSKLQNGESWIFKGTYPVTQEDIDAGTVYNIATASSNETEDDTDDATVLLEQTPALSIVKKVANMTHQGEPADLAALQEGETAIYTVTVTNTGNSTLYNVILTDSEAASGTPVEFEGGGTDAFDSEGKLNLGTMEPGDYVTLFYIYETVYADIDRSPIVNVATASTMIDDEETLEVSDSATIEVEAIPLGLAAIEISKQVKNVTASGSYADLANGLVGNTFNYKITVTNTGSTKLSDVILKDDKIAIGTQVLINGGPAAGAFIGIGGVASIVIGELMPGDTVIYTFNYVSTAQDADDVIVNTATVNAVFKPVREGYEDVPLSDNASATITVVSIPIATGETGATTLAGLALLFGAAALVLFRKRRQSDDLIRDESDEI